MPDTKVSADINAAALTGVEEMHVTQGGVDRSANISQAATYTATAYGLLKGAVAAAAPTINDDSGAGYSVGSGWLNTALAKTYVLLDATVGAAIWKEEAAGSDHPGYISGLYYTQQNVTVLVTAAAVADTLYAHPIYIREKVTVQRLGARCATGLASTAIKMGIYRNSSSRPGVKIAEGNQTPATTAQGDVTTTFTVNPILYPGIYWFASLHNGAPSMNTISGADRGMGALIGGTSPTNLVHTATQACGVSRTSVTYASGLPDPFGSATVLEAGNGAVPLVAFQVA